MTNSIQALAASPRSSFVPLVGKNSRGDWIVRDPSGRRGGLFTSRATALRYVRLETGNRTPAVIDVPGNLEL